MRTALTSLKRDASFENAFENLESLTDGRRRRHAFCARRGKKRAGASVVFSLTQGSAPYRSLHPGLLCAAPTGAWLMYGSWGAGLFGQRRHAPQFFASSRLCNLTFEKAAIVPPPARFAPSRLGDKRNHLLVLLFFMVRKKRIHRAPTLFSSFVVSIFMAMDNLFAKSYRSHPIRLAKEPDGESHSFIQKHAIFSEKENAMSHKSVRCKYTVRAQLCHLFPPYLVSKIAHEQGVDKKRGRSHHGHTSSPWATHTWPMRPVSMTDATRWFTMEPNFALFGRRPSPRHVSMFAHIGLVNPPSRANSCAIAIDSEPVLN